MKNSLLFGLVLVASAFFLGCSKDDSPSSSIVGTYVVESLLLENCVNDLDFV